MKADERICPACAEVVKRAASLCKHCGHKFRSIDPAEAPPSFDAEREGRNFKTALALGIIGIISLVAYCTPDKAANDAAKSANAVATAKESPLANESTQMAWIGKSQEGIKAKLRDPDSAEFRDSRFYSGGSAPVVCGEVNSKNGFGGYGGYQRFIASGEKLAFLESEMTSSSEMDDAWKKMCVKAPTDEAHVPW
ncbi:hypothetical protein [Tsuneonella dongtanensis]|nr:hypothetical protein [Tsuneonella dongtanensis]